MSYALEVYYPSPTSEVREASLTQQVAELGGRLDYREEIKVPSAAHSICLTYEFDEMVKAERAAETLRENGEHVEGPMAYG